MPSSLSLNGLKIFRPGVYATVDASALGGSSPSVGNVCVVGAFAAFEQGVALTFTSAQSLSRYDHSDRELAHIGKVAFAPSLDERIPAGANSLTILNVASSMYYGGSLLGSVGFGGDRVNGLSYEWSQSEAMSSGEATFDVSDMASDGALSVSLSTTAHTQSVVVAITGADLSGASASATLTFAAGNADAQVTAAFGRIDSVSAISDDASYAGSVVVDGSKAFAPADYASLREMWGALDQLPSVTATYLAAREYDADAFDADTSADVSGSVNALSFRCDLQEIIEALASSQLVTAERPTLGTLSLVEQTSGSSVSLLSGGAVSAVSLSDWTDALTTIESADLQIIVAWSDAADVHAEVATHLRAAALAGRERNAWVGSSANESLSALNTRAKALNNRNIALVGQQVRLTAPTGEAVTRPPQWLALMLAGMQAGSPIATPLTRKAPNVLDVFGAWDADRDAAQAIRSGVTTLSRGPLGWRVERSVTTWLRDDNPIYSEVSANESVNTSVRDLRAGLDGFIGEPNRSLTANRIKSIVEARLNRQVLDGVIKNFRNVVLEDLGDTLRVNYEVAAVEPLNFISVTASVNRF